MAGGSIAFGLSRAAGRSKSTPEPWAPIHIVRGTAAAVLPLFVVPTEWRRPPAMGKESASPVTFGNSLRARKCQVIARTHT